jgi:Arc/MetJ family transcription regulator
MKIAEDNINKVMRTTGMDYMQAYYHLAARAGVQATLRRNSKQETSDRRGTRSQQVRGVQHAE